MDEQRFDDLVKRVASTSRRQVLGSLLGGLGAAVSVHGAGAEKRTARQKSSPKQKRPRKQRVTSDGKPAPCQSGVTCGGECCSNGAVCSKGKNRRCVCPTGMTLCARTKACVSTTCGSAGQVYDTDACECRCPNGQELCGPQGNQTCVQSCASPQTLNPSTCQCACPTVLSCTYPEFFDTGTCTCSCGAADHKRCGAICCGPVSNSYCVLDNTDQPHCLQCTTGQGQLDCQGGGGVCGYETSSAFPCVCLTDAAQNPVCMSQVDPFACLNGTPCVHNSDCGTGFRCVRTSSSETGGRCVKECALRSVW